MFTNKESVNTQAAPFFSETNEIKLIIVGNVGSGKTTGIQAVSEIPVVCCEAKANEDDALRRKSTTTVAMDYGVFHLLETKLHLYGTPGQRRFDFMASILCPSSSGMIVMIDNGCEEPIQELDYFLNFHKEYLKINPAVIAVTHYDDFNTDTHLIDYHQYVMQHGFDCAVTSLDARNKEQFRKVILELLIEIIQRR